MFTTFNPDNKVTVATTTGELINKRFGNLTSDKPAKKYRHSGCFDVVTFNNNYRNFHSVYIKRVIYNKPATIVMWSDNTKTITKCSEKDVYSPEIGLMMCIAKKIAGATSIHDTLKEWCPDTITGNNVMTLKEIRKAEK